MNSVNEEVSCLTCHEKNSAQNNYCRSCGALLRASLVGENRTCPFCQQLVADSDFSCPNCGRKIREKQLSKSLLSQLGIYLLSFFLPPLGLWPGFKYLRQKDQTRRWIGIIAIILTFVSILVTAYYTIQIVNQVNEQVNKQLENMTF
ncbi:MAG: zinc ribbon domain-containing protein [Patescibacteria group bacterium]